MNLKLKRFHKRENGYLPIYKLKPMLSIISILHASSQPAWKAGRDTLTESWRTNGWCSLLFSRFTATLLLIGINHLMDGIEQLQALIQKLHIALLPVCLFIVSLPFHILEKEKESVSITSSKVGEEAKSWRVISVFCSSPPPGKRVWSLCWEIFFLLISRDLQGERLAPTGCRLRSRRPLPQ